MVWVRLMSEAHLPFELVALENGNTRRLTFVQDSFLAPLQLANCRGFQEQKQRWNNCSPVFCISQQMQNPKKNCRSFFTYTADPLARTILLFSLVSQILASAGYAVAQINYRGSSGRGIDYTRAIYADWGNKEVIDILGAVDYLVAQGIADPNRFRHWWMELWRHSHRLYHCNRSHVSKRPAVAPAAHCN